MRAWLAATVAAVLLAGCGTAPAGSGTGRALASASVSVSATGLRARALALAWRLVTELRPPPGTRSVHLKKLPPPLTDPLPLPPGWVRVQRTLAGPAEPRAAWAGLLARSPLGQTGGISPGASVGMFIPAPEPGIDVAEISVTLIQLSSKTILIVTDAEAAWLPARTTVACPPRRAACSSCVRPKFPPSLWVHLFSQLVAPWPLRSALATIGLGPKEPGASIR